MTASSRTKTQLYEAGVDHIKVFCDLNSFPMPVMRPAKLENWRFDACAFYRPQYIAICIPKCATIGTAAQAWSYPGYVIDRTPFGVVAHELGHHADYMMGSKKGDYWSDYGANIRNRSGEDKITNYCPNDAEWFAEIFRLFVTNPDLLQRIRPRAFGMIAKDFRPLECGHWTGVLKDAPQRTIEQAAKKIVAAEKSSAGLLI